MSPPFIAADQVAPLIGFRNGHTFLANRERLENEEGFPLPLPTSRRPLLWRRDEVEAWSQEAGRPRAPAAPFTRAQLRVVENARTP